MTMIPSRAWLSNALRSFWVNETHHFRNFCRFLSVTKRVESHFDDDGISLVLQRDFTFLIEPDVAYDATDKPLHGDAGNN
jgi:hypothetical protein